MATLEIGDKAPDFDLPGDGDAPVFLRLGLRRP